MRRLISFSALAAAVLAGAPVSARPSADPWKSLRRPLHVPRIALGTPCPTSAADPLGELDRFGFVGTAWGRGPAYPVLGPSREKPVLTFAYPPPPESGFAGSAWSGQKVMWVVAPSYAGRLLVRGRRLDGSEELRFESGLVPARELRLRPNGGRYGQPSYTRLRAPGCYGYQVDGRGFSRVIVFEARLGGPALVVPSWHPESFERQLGDRVTKRLKSPQASGLRPL